MFRPHDKTSLQAANKEGEMSGLRGIRAKGIQMRTKFICKSKNSVSPTARTVACSRLTSRFVSTAS